MKTTVNEGLSISDKEKLDRLIAHLSVITSDLRITEKGFVWDREESLEWHEKRLKRNLSNDTLHAAVFHLKKIIFIREDEIIKKHCI
jgi:hypothetical protein